MYSKVTDSSEQAFKLIVVTEQRSRSVRIFRSDMAWTDDNAMVWAWYPDVDAGVAREHRGWFDFLSEAKLCKGGEALLVTASGGAVAQVSLGRGSVDWYIRVGGNPHSGCVLPDESIVYASSDGNTIGMIPPSSLIVADHLPGSHFKIPLIDAHGVWYDSVSRSIFALGAHEIIQIRHAVSPSLSPPDVSHSPHTPPGEVENIVYPEVISRITLPERNGDSGNRKHGGHDLALYDYHQRQLFVTDTSAVWVFSPDLAKFQKFPPLRSTGDVKSISCNSTTGEIIFVRAREQWWSDRVFHLQNGFEWYIPDARFYKARWLEADPRFTVLSSRGNT